MVAFSRITFALAVAGLSSAQSFSGPAPSGAFPSGAARPTGGFGGHGHGGHGGHGTAPTVAPSSGLERRQQPSGTPPAFSGSFPAPSGGFPSGGFPESGAPFPTGAFSGFPSGVAHPSGHHGHHGHGGKPSGKPSGPAPTGFVTSTVRGA